MNTSFRKEIIFSIILSIIPFTSVVAGIPKKLDGIWLRSSPKTVAKKAKRLKLHLMKTEKDRECRLEIRTYNRAFTYRKLRPPNTGKKAPAKIIYKFWFYRKRLYLIEKKYRPYNSGLNIPSRLWILYLKKAVKKYGRYRNLGYLDRSYTFRNRYRALRMLSHNAFDLKNMVNKYGIVEMGLFNRIAGRKLKRCFRRAKRRKDKRDMKSVPKLP